MKSSIIKIGDREGIILPTSLLQELNLSSNSTVEMEIDNGAIIIKPNPREGWAEAAKQMHAAGDDQLLVEDVPNEFDRNEWTW